MAIIRKKLTQLINIYSDRHFDKHIGRGSGFGNPFRIGPNCTREQSIEKHRKWLQEWILHKKEIIIRGYSNKWVIENLHELKGKTLACYCWPLPCHGNTLIDLIKQRAKENGSKKALR